MWFHLNPGKNTKCYCDHYTVKTKRFLTEQTVSQLSNYYAHVTSRRKEISPNELCKILYYILQEVGCLE